MKLALLLLSLFALDASAGRSVGLRIDGTDALCSGYTVSTDSGLSVLTCNSTPIPPGAPTNCVATVNGVANTTLPAAGGAAALSVACSETSGVTYNWSRNSTFGANTNRTWTDTLASNPSSSTPVVYNYQVRACLTSNCVVVPASALVATVSPTGGFTGSCPGFDRTVVLDFSWAAPVRLYTGTLGPNDAVVVRFTTGTISSTSSLPRVAGAEYQSPPSARVATLSATACDFTAQSAPGANIAGNSVTAVFAVGSGSGYGYYPVVPLSTLRYVNIKNAPNSTCATGGECGMFFDLIKSGL